MIKTKIILKKMVEYTNIFIKKIQQLKRYDIFLCEMSQNTKLQAYNHIVAPKN